MLEPDAVQQRQPGAQQVHRHGLHSLVPGEEWSVDGHDKLVIPMGLRIWGVVDKFSRKAIDFYVVPNNRNADTVLACFLLAVKEAGGTFPNLQDFTS